MHTFSEDEITSRERKVKPPVFPPVFPCGAVIVPEVILLVRGLESLVGVRYAAASNVVLIVYALAANLLSLLCKTLPSYGGFIIPRFHLSHFVALYSPSGLRVMLDNLAANKPAFVTPGIIGVTLGISLVVLVATLIYARATIREQDSPVPYL